MVDKSGYYLDADGEAYEVIANAEHTETGEKLVIYRRVLGASPVVMARPESTWNETVNDKKRFRRVSYFGNIVDE